MLAILAIVASGCSGPCREIAASRHALLARTASAPEPHARIAIPFAVANPLLADAFADQPELPLPASIPQLGTLGARLLGVELAAAKPGFVGFVARVAVHDDSGELVTLRVHAEVAPTIETGHTLVVAIRADSLTRVEPESSERVRAELARRLPRVPRIVIDELADRLVAETYRLLRVALLAHLGELAQIRIALPALPITSVEVSSDDSAVTVAIHTSLPVRAGLGAAPAADRDSIGVEITASAAAEAINWSIANGRAPAKYDRDLKPRSDGHFTPIFDWNASDPARPLVVHVFGDCEHFEVALLPHVELQGGELRIWTTQKQLERVDAPAPIEAIARLLSLVERTASDPKHVAASAPVTIGGRELDVHVVRVSLADNVLHFAISGDGLHRLQ